MPTELDRIREACAPQEYRALGLGECVEIAEEVEAARGNGLAILVIMETFEARGFSPSDVRQCAEEALRNLRSS